MIGQIAFILTYRLAEPREALSHEKQELQILAGLSDQQAKTEGHSGSGLSQMSADERKTAIASVPGDGANA